MLPLVDPTKFSAKAENKEKKKRRCEFNRITRIQREDFFQKDLPVSSEIMLLVAMNVIPQNNHFNNFLLSKTK